MIGHGVRCVGVIIALLCVTLSGARGFESGSLASHRNGSQPARIEGAAARRSASQDAGGASQNMAYHGGAVMGSSTSYAIFWLPPGYRFEPHGSDAAYESLIQQYFRDVGGTSFYNILSQYSYSKPGRLVYRGPLRNNASLGGVYVDTRPYPRRGTTHAPLFDNDIRSEVRHVNSITHWKPSFTHMFFVFTAAGVQLCTSSLEAQCTFDAGQDSDQWCAWHSASGTYLMYAAMPDALSLANCNPPPGPNGDPWADATVNWISHEQFETISDPVLTAWYQTDAGGEIGDKCDWNFGRLRADGGNITLNAHRYLVQMEWSNLDRKCVLSSNYVLPKSPKRSSIPRTAPRRIHAPARLSAQQAHRRAR